MGLLQTLINQSRLPSGFLGRRMLKIMNNAHKQYILWGLAQLKPGKRVLDISCGGGMALHLLSKENWFEKIYGIDISAEAVHLAAKRNKKQIDNERVTIKQASVLELPFEDGYFDAITTFQSHYHWPDIIKSTQEIYRKLNNKGQFILVSELYKMSYHMKEYNNAELTKVLFKECGFKNIRLLYENKAICIIGEK